jgi:hypothetical protein
MMNTLRFTLWLSSLLLMLPISVVDNQGFIVPATFFAWIWLGRYYLRDRKAPGTDLVCTACKEEEIEVVRLYRVG